jgi:predicted dehydrogenase
MGRDPLRVGVVGVGHVGSRHAQLYASMPGVQVVAVCDTQGARARALARRLRCDAVRDVRRLIGRIHAASIAVPTTLHAEVSVPLLQHGIHCLVEKPIAATLQQADQLIRTARRLGCVLHIGHVERFNAALRAALRHLTHPRFIEVHRLSPYPFRGTDVSVVLDVMIHDLDLLLWLVRSPIRRIEAVGLRVLSRSEDIANVRVTFASGCVANLTASRISDETIRRLRVFQEDGYLSIDHHAQTVELARLARGTIRRVQLPVNRRAPLEDELAAFVNAVRRKQRPVVSGEEGRAALALALRIERAIKRSEQ